MTGESMMRLVEDHRRAGLARGAQAARVREARAVGAATRRSTRRLGRAAWLSVRCGNLLIAVGARLVRPAVVLPPVGS